MISYLLVLLNQKPHPQRVFYVVNNVNNELKYLFNVGRFAEANNLVPKTSASNCFSRGNPRFCISRNSLILIPLNCKGTRLIRASPRIRNVEASKL
jgi:hypothetical protein